MNTHGILLYACSFLLAAVVAVPIAKKFGLGAVIGYLIAGAALGPWGIKLVDNPEDIMHFAELGVVLLLFLIGLELSPKRLWALRRPIFGMGAAQVLATTAVLAVCGVLLGAGWNAALVGAMALSLSSTAIAVQSLAEKNLLATSAGRASFSVLLFQDLAVIPMLALLPLLGNTGAEPSAGPTAKVLSVLAALGVIVGIIVCGRFLVHPIFRIMASTRQREIFTAFSLFLVIGIALLMSEVGMSMALGTFLAGVILADSEYRHELESNIEPFKGLLLGLFFVSVGMSVDFGLLAQKPVQILGLVCAIVALKVCALFAVGRVFKMSAPQALIMALFLSQGGEFAFVLFGIARQLSVMDPQQVALLTVAVALSMMTTPPLILLYEKKIAPKFVRPADRPDDAIEDESNPVIIAGLGRFGQITSRLLHANGVQMTIVDHSSDSIERVRRFGYKVYYGDASNVELLHAAGAARAKVFVVAVDDRETTSKIVKMVKRHFPHLKIIARAWDVIHPYDLRDLGVDAIQRETFESALAAGEDAMRALGVGAHQAKKAAAKFRQYDAQLVSQMYDVRSDSSQVVSVALEARREVERLFAEDEKAIEQVRSARWD